ncbi:hypothetical protein [Erythrobacter sp.]|uniref:hypothetical protein n=1 Tax=Erythrobacter sp. TaxID=1042 RepID=UPI0025D36803|nr:hypothetical protein [Erythrobacter sp.]
MKIAFSAPGLPRKGRQIFNEKIINRHASPMAKGQRQDRIKISKTGRLVVIDFACALNEMDRGHLTLTEAEILLLAKLCRRNRDDQAFLRAINDAGASSTEIRKRRRTAYSENLPDED